MPNDQISINYDYMLHGDIVITNWDSGKGNFIYYNTNNTVGISEYAMLEAPLAIEKIYPQPADHIINITLNKAVMHDIQYRILDVTAKELYNEICQGNTSHRISVSQLTGGIYIIEVSDGVTIARKKFIKAR